MYWTYEVFALLVTLAFLLLDLRRGKLLICTLLAISCAFLVPVIEL